nr:transposase family protein [Streptomyces sp. 5-10]
MSWRLPLAERLLLVAVLDGTNLTMSQLAPLFGISPTTVCRVIQRLGRGSGMLGVIHLVESRRVVLTRPARPDNR